MAGGEAKPLTTGMSFDSQPRFSPDGSRVVFVSDRDGGENVWTVGVDGEDPLKLSEGGEMMQFASPSFSPDGSHVVVSRTSWALRTFELWAYHIDGGQGIQITQAKNGTDTPASQRSNSLGAC